MSDDRKQARHWRQLLRSLREQGITAEEADGAAVRFLTERTQSRIAATKDEQALTTDIFLKTDMVRGSAQAKKIWDTQWGLENRIARYEELAYQARLFELNHPLATKPAHTNTAGEAQTASLLHEFVIKHDLTAYMLEEMHIALTLAPRKKSPNRLTQRD